MNLVQELRSRRKEKYGEADIREFTAMFKEGITNKIPPDIAPFLVKYRPQNDDELSFWIHECLEKQGLTCYFTREPNHLQTDLQGTCSHMQFMCDAFFDRAGDCIVLGNRASSKTLCFAAMLLIESVLKPGIELAHLGAIEDQAKRCYRYFRKMTDHPLFSHLLARQPTSTRVELVNGSSVEILVGTMSGVNCLHGDMLVDCSRDKTAHPDGIPIRDLVGKDFKVPAIHEGLGAVRYLNARGVYSGKSKCLRLNLVRSLAGEVETASIVCTPEHPMMLAGSFKYEHAKNLVPGMLLQPKVPYGDEYIPTCPVWEVQSVESACNGESVDVYDIVVGTKDRFCHNFQGSTTCYHNSPHPITATLDEVELIDWAILQEAFNMARSGRGYHGSTRLTSTRKKASGTMQRLLDEAPQRGFKIYKWNLWDTIQTCPLTEDDMGQITDKQEIYTYLNGKGEPSSCFVYSSCMNCPMLPACRGQAKTSNAGPNGVVKIQDAIKNYKTLDKEVWDAQVICVKPGRSNLIYNMFEPDYHVVDYTDMLKAKYGNHYEHSFDTDLEVYAGQDAGFGCPATVFLQVIDDPETGEQTVVIFDELYEKNIAPSKYVSEFLLPKHDLYNVVEWFCDPSNSQQLMAEMELQDLYTIPGLKNVDEGIDAIKALFSMGKLLIDKKCKNLIWELGRYEKGPNGKPKKVDDHLCDASRFGIMGVGIYDQTLSEVYK